jgi:hypothetical protein
MARATGLIRAQVTRERRRRRSITMNTPSDMVVVEGRGPGGKFAKGHKFGGGTATINRLTKKLHYRLVKRAARNGDVDKLYQQLLKDAQGANEGAVRVAAAKVLLGYVLGKPDQTLNVKDVRPPKATYSLDQLIQAVIAAGGDPDRFPMLAAHRRKHVEAKVSDPKLAP